jgi:hypothetical protein
MKEIPLTQGKFAIVDDTDFEELNQFKWCAVELNHHFYATRMIEKSKNPKKNEFMHRRLLPPPNNLEIDHINGNGLDNRRENLRIVTHRQNMQNLHISKSSKYPGVTWDKRGKKWTAQIWIKGKLINLGSFKEETNAAAVYNIACQEKIGDSEMTKIKKPPKNPLGKPLGTRQKDGLYTKILGLLQQDKDQKGDGYTAFAISGYLAEPYPTVQQYLADLVAMKKVKARKIIHLTLFSIK